MRRARFFPVVVVGLGALAGQAALLSRSHAWDAAPAAFIEDMNANALEPRNQARLDRSVEQAGYYDSRPRPISAAAGMQSSSQRGALYRGQKMKMPTLPFGRAKNSPKPLGRVPQSPASANGPASRPIRQPQPPIPTASELAAQQRKLIQQSLPGRSATPNAAFETASVVEGRSPEVELPVAQPGPRPQGEPLVEHAIPQRRNASPRPAPLPAVANSTPNSTDKSPWSSPSTSLIGPTSRSASAHPVSDRTAQRPEGPSPADRLVTEAHELSTRAQYEEDYTQIIETCRRAQAVPSSDTATQFSKNLLAWSMNRRGQMRAESGREKEAILDFDEAIRNDPTCWRALHNRGVLLAQAGQFEMAFDDFSKTIQLNPEFAKAHSNRAALYLVANKLEASLADYQRAIELDPNLAVAHRGCGRVCQLLGQVEHAIAHYDASVQLAPNDGYAAACRADLLTDIGRYAEAEAEYERAIKIDPSLSQAHGGSAWLLATCPDNAIRNPELAIERAKSAIERGGERDALNYDTLAAALASAGDFQGAMAAARKAIELAPEEERETYRDRFTLYQQAKPYRIAPVERIAQQASYEERVE